ncbi:hypothetical protein JTE90_011699 [Oedothorax gibbosus]|uniref:Uncharacterized protein n=1 Tax=Oedothorax gibbosus TaxID=931172 RepID=A0AAV6UU49_9ARAC|nr:hypothetical protein JTE90_011699 [Oedothorax gibbosus]
MGGYVSNNNDKYKRKVTHFGFFGRFFLLHPPMHDSSWLERDPLERAFSRSIFSQVTLSLAATAGRVLVESPMTSESQPLSRRLWGAGWVAMDTSGRSLWRGED